MGFKTPKFWYAPPSKSSAVITAALSSLSAVYTLGHLIHQFIIRQEKVNVPVLCIGNLVAGGGGKTPAALSIMEIIQKETIFLNPCFLSRGYGGRLGGPVLVNPSTHTAQDVGDEPLLLAGIAPTIICKDRVAGANYAQSLGHDFIIMDDGLQNPGLYKDVSIVVVDGSVGFGNRLILPAGPLRTPLHRGLKNADIILLIGDDQTNALGTLSREKVVLCGDILSTAPKNHAPRYHAFCGIARPEKFYNSLAACKLNITGTTDYPDHHIYSQADVNTLRKKAEAEDAKLITTTKDAVKLYPLFPDETSLDVLKISLSIKSDSIKKILQFIGSIK